MKQIIMICAVMCAVSFGYAQGLPIGPSVGFGVHGTLGFVSIPGPEVNGATPLDEVYGAGYGGGVHLDIEFVVLSIRASADYITFSPDDAKYQSALTGFMPGSVASDFSIEGGRVNIFGASVNGKLALLPLPIVSPYLTGGIGLARISADAAEVSFQGMPATTYPGFTSETSTAINIGAGVDLSLFLDLFVEARYTWILAEGSSKSYIPVSIGITF